MGGLAREVCSQERPALRNAWLTIVHTCSLTQSTHLFTHMCSIVCLVVDECHRAVGNAAMAKAVAQLRKARVQFRLLGLSATPGSTHEAIQV